MSEFKAGDKVWMVLDDLMDKHPVFAIEEGTIQSAEEQGWVPEDSKDWIRVGCRGFRPDIFPGFHDRKDALAEAIRLNEELAARLSDEITRLKDELGKL